MEVDILRSYHHSERVGIPETRWQPPATTSSGHDRVKNHALSDLVHPNHVAQVGSQVLVTRFADRCIQNLRSWRKVVPETPGHPHDGQLHDGVFWITCTNGLVVGYRLSPRGEVVGDEALRHDVFATTGRSGWCRGLWIDSDLWVVGLTELRRQPGHTWCDRPYGETETSLLFLSPRDGRLKAHLPLARFGHHPKVFTILGLPGTVRGAE